MRKVSKNFINPHPLHAQHDTPEAIRDAFLHAKWHLEKCGWDTADFTDLLGIARHTWYQYGHKLDSRGYRQIPADALDQLRREVVLDIASQLDRYHDPFKRHRDQWTVGEVTTYSKTLAIYLSGFTGDFCIAVDTKNAASDTLTVDEKLLLEWLTISKQVNKSQLMKVTGLGEFDVGRVGLHVARWGIEPKLEWLQALRTMMKTQRGMAMIDKDIFENAMLEKIARIKRNRKTEHPQNEALDELVRLSEESGIYNLT